MLFRAFTDLGPWDGYCSLAQTRTARIARGISVLNHRVIPPLNSDLSSLPRPLADYFVGVFEQHACPKPPDKVLQCVYEQIGKRRSLPTFVGRTFSELRQSLFLPLAQDITASLRVKSADPTAASAAARGIADAFGRDTGDRLLNSSANRVLLLNLIVQHDGERLAQLLAEIGESAKSQNMEVLVSLVLLPSWETMPYTHIKHGSLERQLQWSQHVYFDREPRPVCYERLVRQCQASFGLLLKIHEQQMLGREVQAVTGIFARPLLTDTEMSRLGQLAASEANVADLCSFLEHTERHRLLVRNDADSPGTERLRQRGFDARVVENFTPDLRELLAPLLRKKWSFQATPVNGIASEGRVSK